MIRHPKICGLGGNIPKKSADTDWMFMAAELVTKWARLVDPVKHLARATPIFQNLAIGVNMNSACLTVLDNSYASVQRTIDGTQLRKFVVSYSVEYIHIFFLQSSNLLKRKPTFGKTKI